MPEEINTNDINSNEINEQILLNQDEKITETNQLLGATMQQNEERKQLSEAGLMAQEAIKEKMNGKPSIYVSTIIDAFLESLGEKLKGKDGQKGEKGDVPKKGVDYFTPEDINDIQEYVQSQIKDGEDGYTPIKGKDYFTPKEIDTIVSQVRNLIPTPKDGRDGRDPTIDYDIMVKRVLSKIKLPAVKQLTAKEILDMVKGKIKYEDIKNTPTIFKQAGKMAGQGYFKDLADVNFSDAVNDQSYSLKRVNNTWTVTKTETETSWGEILGTLTDQVDLKNALDGKVGTTGDETIAGIKTFSSIPVLPATNPTTDNQVTRKGYVDSLVSGAIVLQGDWNASTNTPDISGTTKTGSAWRVNVAGTTDIGGITDWQVGDLAVKTATDWIKIDNEDIRAVWGGITGTLADQTDLQNELDGKEDSIVYPTVTPETKYYRGDKTFHEMVVGSGGFAGNVYPSEVDDAVISGYKQLSYTPDAAETEKTIVVNNNTVTGLTAIYPDAVGVEIIPSGTWRAVVYAKVSSTIGGTTMKLQVFKRTTGGTETDLFEMESETIENTADYALFRFESSQLGFATNTTDRLGARIKGATTRTSNTTISYIIGNGRGLYFNTTLPTRHDTLRDKDGEDAYQHLTLAQKTIVTQAATSLLDGYLDKDDFATFNGKQDALGYTAENAANKLTSFQATPDDTHYASEKLVKDSLDSKQNTMTKAAGTDIDTGTDDSKYATSKAIKDSTIYGKKTTSETSSATPTPTGNYAQNEYYLTALAVNAVFAAPSGTPVNGNNLIIRIKDAGAAKTLGFNAIFRAIGVDLPTTTVISKTIYLGCKYNSADSKWDILAVGEEE